MRVQDPGFGVQGLGSRVEGREVVQENVRLCGDQRELRVQGSGFILPKVF